MKRRKPFATGIFVNPSRWDAKNQCVERGSSEREIANTQLTIIKNNLCNAFLSLQLERKDFTVEDILLKYSGKPLKQKQGLVQYFEKYLQKCEKLIGKDLQLGTWKKYNYACLQACSFVQWKYGKKDLPLDDLSLQFLVDFEYFLKTEKDQAQSTINKTIQRLRKPIRSAVAEGYLKKDPFMLHKPKRVRKPIVFLSEEELLILENHDFQQPRLRLVRDLFVFCCYTGLAYREMSELKRENIQKGFDGNEWIRIRRHKTDKEVSVPLLPKAKSILSQYKSSGEYLLPKFSNQKINSYLKEIAGIIGIDKTITHHMARRTFASTVLLYNDVPLEVVSELLGHSSIRITQESYGKVVQKKLSMEMNRIAGLFED